MKKYALIIHGGAGNITNLTEGKKALYLNSLRTVLKAGRKLLAAGALSIDVVEKCVGLLEDNPIFNAGKGSVINTEGEVEMDASIMDGRNLKAGSVIGLKHYKNPIQVARKVMDQTEHVMLACDGAEAFAKSAGFKYYSNNYFKTKMRMEQFKEAKKQKKVVLDVTDLLKNKKLGTVGAVAFDLEGNLAAATSTGGISNKLKGRVGDTPVIGAGFYASNALAGVSATGYGEQFLRSVLAFYAATQVSKNSLAPKACERAMNYLKDSVSGLGGIIMIDRFGNIGTGATSQNLIHGFVGTDVKLQVSLVPHVKMKGDK